MFIIPSPFKKKLFLIFVFVFKLAFVTKAQTEGFRIAFGSCAHEDHPLPVFKTIVEQKPNLFIFLGDNIYADTDDPEIMRKKYQQLSKNKGFRKLRRTTPVIATWDDHDFGRNDAGRHYPMKEISKQIFLDFFKEPINSSRRNHEGIYTSYYYPIGEKVLQIILLDTRTFRDNVVPYVKKEEDRFYYTRDYLPHTNSDSTLLGGQQWAWLKEELSQKADIRIIASSTQFGIEYNGYESWANFPHEQEKMLQLINETRANGVFFISGDVHYAELSKLMSPLTYPIYDLTSSGLSSTWDFATPNHNRIAGTVMENNFGMITIFMKEKDPEILFEIIDVSGNQAITHKIHLKELQY